MKKSTIWFIAVTMGLLFLGLLYLQVKYFEESLHIRKEQFDESVARSLYQACHDLELSEAKVMLERELNLNRPDTSTVVRNAKPHESIPANVSKGLFLDNLTAQPADTVLRDALRQRMLLGEVLGAAVYDPTGRPLAERVDFPTLDANLRTALRNNGISIDYHFYVTTSDGREVYRCVDFVADGMDYQYSHILFPNGPSAQKGVLYIHFPDLHKYIFASVRFFITALVFTLILLIVFIFTIYIIFRQKRLTEIKNDFINNMTHEFKTPISTISLAAQMLGDGSVTKSESMLKHLSGIIVDETKRLRFQVEKVLQMSMFEKKADTFKRKELDANRVIQDIVTTFRLKVETAGGSIDAHVEAAKDMVFVDEMHFTNVVFNLMDNAIKYKHPDRPLQLRVSTESTDSRYIIRVADNGIGIKKEDLKKIFEKFYRVHTGNRHDVKGFGLGLAYVKNVVTALGGNIHAESEYGRGTTFIISLPLLK